MRARSLFFLLVSWSLVLACGRPIHISFGQPTPQPAAPAAMPAATATALPVLAPTLPEVPAAGPTETPTETRPDKPAVNGVYPLAHPAGWSSHLAVSGDRVWVGTLQGLVDVHDSKDGSQLQGIPLFPGAGGMEPQVVFDVAYDGKNLWALATEELGVQADALFVLTPADGKVLRQYDTSDWGNHDDARLGLSPGKVWTEAHVIDTQTLEPEHKSHPDSPTYAYDGNGWMWIGGTFCSGCGLTIWIFNAANPDELHDGPKAAGQTQGNSMAVAGDRMWLTAALVGMSSTQHVLQAYPADGSQVGEDSQPMLELPLVDDRPLRMLYDGQALWLLAGGEKQGTLFQLDPVTGEEVSRLEMPSSQEGDVPWDMAFDGRDLWVLTTLQLVRVSLPW